MMKPERRCVDCGVDISGRGPSSKRCEEHAISYQRENNRLRLRSLREANPEYYWEYERGWRSSKKPTRSCLNCGEAKKQLITCKRCGITVIRTSSTKLFCSKSCQKKTYRESNLASMRLRERSLRLKNAKRNRAQARKRYKDHAGKTMKLKYEQNPKLYRERANRYRLENLDACKLALAKWRANNNEKKREHDQKRKAKKLNQYRNVSEGISQKLLIQQGRKCAALYCRKKLEKRDSWHLDHIMPLALGGLHDDSNLQILCVYCNLSKHAKHPNDWLKEHGYLPLEARL